MRLEWEGKKPIENVTEGRLRYRLGRKRGGDTSYVILSRPDGSYVQMLGGGVACCLEWRDTVAHRHFRAFVSPSRVPWRNESMLGRLLLAPEEHLFIEDVVGVFCAFLTEQAFPAEVQWRDITEELAANGVARP